MSDVLIPNGRDLGGRRTRAGLIVRHGAVLRSAAPGDPQFVPHLEELGVRTVYDLRTAEEQDQRPDFVNPSARLVSADMLADEPQAGPASLGRIARAALAGETANLTATDLRQTFTTGYRSFVTMTSARRVSGEVLGQVAEPGSGTVLIHCTAGKDRTGWLAALILMAIDVDWDDIMADYLASGPAVAAMFAPYRELFEERGGDVAAMDVAIGVFPEYLEAARAAMIDRFGSLDRYLVEGLALPADSRERLANRLLQPA